MTRIGVLAHAKKELAGSTLDDLRRALERRGVRAPAWHEIEKPDDVRGAVGDMVSAGVETLFVWGGDGTVQRCIDAVGSAPLALALLPAGTANLLAGNLGVPQDLDEALAIGLGDGRRALDLGTVNDERFAVMAGTGFDALMVDAAEGKLKNTLGRLAYVAAAVTGVTRDAVQSRVVVDGEPWYEGPATCVLVGNMGEVIGGLTIFPDADPTDGLLDVGIATAEGPVDWARVVSRTLVDEAGASPLVRITSGRSVEVALEEERPYELDGDARPDTQHLRFFVQPAAIRVCVPDAKEEK